MAPLRLMKIRFLINESFEVLASGLKKRTGGAAMIEGAKKSFF